MADVSCPLGTPPDTIRGVRHQGTGRLGRPSPVVPVRLGDLLWPATPGERVDAVATASEIRCLPISGPSIQYEPDAFTAAAVVLDQSVGHRDLERLVHADNAAFSLTGVPT